MAGNRGQKTGDKKRKREAQDADSKAKRHRKGDQAVNGTNGAKDGAHDETSKSSEVVTTDNKMSQRRLDMMEQTDNQSGWGISKPMGGRMLDIDPILSDDEKYLIVAYNTSIQVYSATDSLIVRRIPISTLDTMEPKTSKPANVVAMRMSKRAPDFVWVACSDGRILHVDWTKKNKAQQTPQAFRTISRTARDLAVVPIGGPKKTEEALLVLESGKPTRLDITAYISDNVKKSQYKNLFTAKNNANGLRLLESADDGRVLVGAFNDRLLLGAATYTGTAETLDDLHYDFFSFDTPDIITSLDIRMRVGGKKSKGEPSSQTVDVLVGGARGAIYLYQDAITRLQSSSKDRQMIQAQKFHWHRKAVHSVKWSRDGSYMISGGSENVLVIWQMDTSKKDFLPHLSGSIENILVSPSGSSYVVHLDDNSTMIISTAEMKPSAYMAGMQTATIGMSVPKDMLVQRLWKAPGHVHRRIPAAISPTEPSKLHVCVGNGRQATMSGEFSAPLLQSFDLESFTSILRQPLARTQPTDVNMTNKGVPIDEPLVTHVSFSSDGRWLASVDEWTPPERDVNNVSADLREEFIRERHEVHLKFWEMGSGDQPAALVSRINAPHATTYPGTVLDLATGPGPACFATIGSDGAVRIWRPRVRKSGGIIATAADGRELYSWACTQAIAFGDSTAQETAVELANSGRDAQPRGSIAFSEDGSTIFAAFGTDNTGVVHVIDAASGEIIKTLQDLWTGELRSIETLSSLLIVLSEELRVYDVTGDELRFGFTVPKIEGVPELLQLTVDHKSGHFAVSLPVAWYSIIAVFDPDSADPLLVRKLPSRVVSLVTSPNTSGFIALDDRAQVWTVAEESDPSSLAAMKPLEDLQVDGAATPAVDGALTQGDVDMDDDEEDEAEPVVEQSETMDVDDEDDGVYSSVVATQHLADIFDAAPAFAGPSVEDMFYKVTNLLGAKPLVAASD